jgi:hypothetical protein
MEVNRGPRDERLASWKLAQQATDTHLPTPVWSFSPEQSTACWIYPSSSNNLRGIYRKLLMQCPKLDFDILGNDHKI